MCFCANMHDLQALIVLEVTGNYLKNSHLLVIPVKNKCNPEIYTNNVIIKYSPQKQLIDLAKWP